MYHFIHRRFGGKSFPQHIQYGLSHIEYLQELLKVQRIHIERLQIADRRRFQIHNFHAQQRTGHDIPEPLIVHKKLDFRDNLLVSLDFIEEKEGLARNDFLIAVQGQLQNQVVYSRCSVQNLYDFRLSDQVELDVVAACRFQALADDIGFSRLPDAVNQQCLITALNPAHNILFNFPFQHHRHLHTHLVRFPRILYRLADTFSRDFRADFDTFS